MKTASIIIRICGVAADYGLAVLAAYHGLAELVVVITAAQIMIVPSCQSLYTYRIQNQVEHLRKIRITLTVVLAFYTATIFIFAHKLILIGSLYAACLCGMILALEINTIATKLFYGLFLNIYKPIITAVLAIYAMQIENIIVNFICIGSLIGIILLFKKLADESKISNKRLQIDKMAINSFSKNVILGVTYASIQWADIFIIGAIANINIAEYRLLMLIILMPLFAQQFTNQFSARQISSGEISKPIAILSTGIKNSFAGLLIAGAALLVFSGVSGFEIINQVLPLRLENIPPLSYIGLLMFVVCLSMLTGPIVAITRIYLSYKTVALIYLLFLVLKVIAIFEISKNYEGGDIQSVFVATTVTTLTIFNITLFLLYKIRSNQ